MPSPVTAPHPGFWAPDGPVHAMAATHGVLYLGGDFDQLLPARGSGLALDAGTLDADPSYPQVQGEVVAVVPDGAGGFYLGGTFTQVGGASRTNLAHINSNGAINPAWAPAVNGPVTVMSRHGRALYLGGIFTALNGTGRTNLAALDAADATTLPWAPVLAAGAELTSLLATRDLVYLAGRFSAIDGTARQGLAALEPDTGALDAWDPQPQGGDVHAMVLKGDTLYLGGDFTSVGGAARVHLAAVDGFSGAALGWDAGLSPVQSTVIHALAADEERLFVGGDFSITIAGASIRGLAALSLADASALGWNAALGTSEVPSRPVVRALALDASRLYVTGDFTSALGLSRKGLVALNLQSAAPAPWGLAWSGTPGAIASSHQTVFVAGAILAEEAVPRSNLAALDAATGQPLDWAIGTDGPVLALTLAHERLYVGGAFSTIGGAALPNLAAVELSGVIAVNGGWDPAPDGAVRALAVVGDTLFMGGDFLMVAGDSRPRLAAFSRLGGALGWNPSADGPVHALAASGLTVYAGGAFTRMGLLSRQRLAAIDTSGSILSWSPLADGPVHALLVAEGGLYAGGGFTRIDAVTRNGLAAFDVATGSMRAWNPGVGGAVHALDCRSTNLVVGGAFTDMGGASGGNLALVDLAGGLVSDWNPGINGPVHAIAASGPILVAGGEFTGAGNHARRFLAAFAREGAPVIVQQPSDQFLFPGETLTLHALASGSAGLDHQWYFDGVQIAGATGPDLVLEELDVDQFGAYHLVVTNPLGVAQSRTASVRIRLPAGITTHPAGITATSGGDVLLAVSADGTPPPRYQWRRNGAVIPGAIGPSLALASVSPTDAGLYSVAVFNRFGLQESLPAEVQVAGAAYPFADARSNLVVTSASRGVYRGDSDRSGLEPGEPNHAGIPGGASVWMGWQAKDTGVATFHTRGSAFDTLLAVYTNSPSLALVAVGGDDDAGGYRASQVRFNAVAGQTYSIAIDGYDGERGNFTLSWDLEAGSLHGPVIVAAPFTRVVEAGATAAFEVQVDQPAAYAYQWYRGDRRIPGATGSMLNIADVDAADTDMYFVEVTDPAGIRLRWRSQGAALQIGPVPTLPFGDKHGTGSFCPFPLDIPGPPGSVDLLSYLSGLGPSVTFGANTFTSLSFNNQSSQAQPLDPSACQVALYATDFQCVQATAPGVFLIDTKGSTVPTVLTAVEGVPLVNTPVGCQITNAPNGFDSILTFTPTPNENYTVLVDGLNGAQGNLTMNIRLCGPPVLVTTPSETFQPVEFLQDAVVFRVLVANPECGASFQWRINGAPVTGATGSSWTNTVPIQPGDQFSVTVVNVAGSVTHVLGTWIELWMERVQTPQLPPYRLRAGPVVPHPFVIRHSDAFMNWFPLHTNPAGTELMLPLDTTNALRRFYRVQP